MITAQGIEIIQGKALKFKEVMTGVSKQDLWGDPAGQHGAITRLKAGLTTPMHTHSSDVRMVVISGTLIHGEANGEQTRLGPGSYCCIPAGLRHTTGCDKLSDCLFYEEQPGRFDMNQVQ